MEKLTELLDLHVEALGLDHRLLLLNDLIMLLHGLRLLCRLRWRRLVWLHPVVSCLDFLATPIQGRLLVH